VWIIHIFPKIVSWKLVICQFSTSSDTYWQGFHWSQIDINRQYNFDKDWVNLLLS
jgi:hypothetical protein